MNESDYNSANTETWSIHAYSVEVPLNPTTGKPWGIVTFYGDPDPEDAGDPLSTTPEPLGRVRRIITTDQSVIDKQYCGPHEQHTVTIFTGGQDEEEAVTRFFKDGLGRLVVVDAPSDASSPGVDAAYEYDLNDNLIGVNLIPDNQLPSDPFGAWRNGSLPQGQIRTFEYDGLGRLRTATNPENGSVQYMSYDPLGKLQAYTDALGSARGYFFENQYDDAGRLIKTQKVRGTPENPTPTDVDLLYQQNISWHFEDMNGWEEGTIDGSGNFVSGDSFWTQAPYSWPCIDPPPSGGNYNALYLGTICRYTSLGDVPQAIRAGVTGVSREDILTFKFWRLVREADLGDKDAFSVWVVDKDADSDGVGNRRELFRKDESQSSFGRWRQTPAMRPGDFFSQTEWPEGTTKNLYLYFVFEKGDASATGLGIGVFIDDVFFGRRGTETLAEYVYDVDACDQYEPGYAAAACSSGVEPSNRYLGNLTHLRSYHDNRLVGQKTIAYKGLNGRPSGERHLIDWTTGVEDMDEWLVECAYNSHGLLAGQTAAHLPGLDSPRLYDYSYVRGMLDRVSTTEGGVTKYFLDSVSYTASGSIGAIQFGNNTSTTINPNIMFRPESYVVEGPDLETGTGTIELWNSGTYKYDDSGNLTDIGNQSFAYDLTNRLIAATVHSQASGIYGDPEFTLAYTYDEYGNMTSRSWDDDKGGTEPVGIEFTGRYYDDGAGNNNNRVTNGGFTYDLNGNLLTMRVLENPLVEDAMTWDSQSRMTAFINVVAGAPDIVTERYMYDANGYRLVRYPEGEIGNGWPVISIRDGEGQLISQYIRKPGESKPVLTKDFVRGAGNLLVEREVSEQPPIVASSTAFYSNGEFGFEVIDGQSGDTYTVDIRTESGYATQLTEVSLDAYDQFQIGENYFAQDETNYVRIRSEGQDTAVYSAPVTLILDPNVTLESENQINKMSVSRVGTDVIIRWGLLSPNGSTTNLYYDRQDGGGTEELVLDLAAAVRSYTVEEQSLATECITIAGTQDDGEGESTASAWVAIPSSVAQDFSIIPPCDQPQPPAIDSYYFSDYYHHRDHLGNLRIVTDAAGARVSAHDYYPFGMEITPDNNPDVIGGSRMRFTGHERDELTNLDYMLARYANASLGRFLSVDSMSASGSLSSPQMWNKYVYAINSPLQWYDPNGKIPFLSLDLPDRNAIEQLRDFTLAPVFERMGMAGAEQVITNDVPETYWKNEKYDVEYWPDSSDVTVFPRGLTRISSLSWLSHFDVNHAQLGWLDYGPGTPIFAAKAFIVCYVEYKLRVGDASGKTRDVTLEAIAYLIHHAEELKELKLTPEQIKKLLELLKKLYHPDANDTPTSDPMWEEQLSELAQWKEAMRKAF